MSQWDPNPGIIRQWETKVVRWVIRGRTREEILNEMTASNWHYDHADQLLRRIVGRQKRKYILTMIICGCLAAAGILVTFVSLTSPQGGAVYVPIGFSAGFIYALVRLTKIRA